MPTYDYECESCGHAFEEFQAMTAKQLKVCPTCKKPKLRRLIGTGAALLFKGSGFYSTDYRSSDYKAKASAESSAASSSSSAANPAACADCPKSCPAKAAGDKKKD